MLPRLHFGVPQRRLSSPRKQCRVQEREMMRSTNAVYESFFARNKMASSINGASKGMVLVFFTWSGRNKADYPVEGPTSSLPLILPTYSCKSFVKDLSKPWKFKRDLDFRFQNRISNPLSYRLMKMAQLIKQLSARSLEDARSTNHGMPQNLVFFRLAYQGPLLCCNQVAASSRS